jgi:hypothetical protein
LPLLPPRRGRRSLKQLSALRDVTCRISHVRSVTVVSDGSVVRVRSSAHSSVASELGHSACCLLSCSVTPSKSGCLWFCLGSLFDREVILAPSPRYRHLSSLPSATHGSDSWNFGDVLVPVACSWLHSYLMQTGKH